MQLSFNEDCLKVGLYRDTYRTTEECLAICRTAGFRNVDFGFSGNPDKGNELFSPNWEEEIRRAGDTAQRLGLKIDQTHAPYTIKSYEREWYLEFMRRAFVAAGMLGANSIVIHADVYDKGDGPYDTDEAVQAAYEFYAPFVEIAVKSGVKVAMENLFEDRPGQGRSRFCSTLEELLAIIGRFDDPMVGACYDFGHARVAFGDDVLSPLMRLQGKLFATHVHDNYAAKDLHTPLCLAPHDFEQVVRYLKESGYEGNFSMEYSYMRFPDALVGDYMALFYRTGEYILSLA